MAGWTWAAWLPRRPAPSGSGSRTARGARSAAAARSCPHDDPFYDPPAGFQHAAPGHGAAQPRRRAGVSRADPAAHHGHPAAVPDHRHERQPGGGRHHGDRARRTRPGGRLPGGVLPVRDRRRDVALLPVLRAAPAGDGARRAGAVRVPADRRGRGRGLGRVGARPRGPQRDVGRTLRARLPGARRAARRAELRAAGPVAVGSDRPVGLLRRRSGQRLGRRDERLLRARAEHRRRGARIARRRSRPHVPPAQRHLSGRAARARRRRARGHLSRPRPGHPGARHRRGQGRCCDGCTR